MICNLTVKDMIFGGGFDVLRFWVFGLLVSGENRCTDLLNFGVRRMRAL